MTETSKRKGSEKKIMLPPKRCCKCRAIYDISYLTISMENLTRQSNDFNLNWICRMCTQLSVHSSITTANNSALVWGHANLVPIVERDATTSYSDGENIAELLQERLSLRQYVQDHKCVTDMPQSVARKMTRYEKALKDKTTEMENLRSSLEALKQTVIDQEQYRARNDIAIINLPETENENLVRLALIIASRLNVQLFESEIDEIHRVGRQRTDKPRPIVMKFVTKIKRDIFLKAAQTGRVMNAREIIPGTKSMFYVNERLVLANRQLFREARDLAKLHRYQSCWVRGGRIYLRKSHAEQTEIHTIRSKKNLERIFGPLGNAEAQPSTSGNV